MRTLKPFILSLVILSFSACKKSSSADTITPVAKPVVTFTATINGTSVIPANTSAATGSATLVYNTDTKIFTIHVTYTGLTATGAHIRDGAAGVNGHIITTFPTFTSPIDFTSFPLDITREADLLANLFYVNIQSAAFADGEIRGQLIKQ